MNINNLLFHLHYCNGRQFNEPWKYSTKIIKTLKHHELFFVYGGKGSIIIGNKRYQIKEGRLFYFCPDVLISIETDIEDPICFLSVHFSYAYVNFSDNKWNIRNETKLLSLNFMEELKNYYQIDNIFKKLIEIWSIKVPEYEFITKSLLNQLIFEIFQNIKKQNQNFSTSLKIEKVIKYMHQNINNKLTLNELAEMVQLSSIYLSRIFKETTGYSVIGFFNKMKIDKAKELIIEGDKKIKEVAQALGFTDEFYFSRVFKRIEGISPSGFYNKNVHGI